MFNEAYYTLDVTMKGLFQDLTVTSLCVYYFLHTPLFHIIIKMWYTTRTVNPSNLKSEVYIFNLTYCVPFLWV